MLAPRIIISANQPSLLVSLQAFGNERLAIYSPTSGLDDKGGQKNQALEMKKICLQHGWLLLLDNIKTAAIVNADGVILPHGDYNHGKAKDILGSDKLVGATAHRIEDVAEFWEEGMTDFIILESYLETPSCHNILGKRLTQTIIDDSKIMGYDIPLIVSGGIEAANAQEVLDMRCYGVQLDNQDDLEEVLQYIRSSPTIL